MADLIISISGGKEVSDKLRSIGAGVLNLRQPMSEIGTYLTRFFSGEVFASRGRVIGEPWSPLKNRTAAYKARRYPGRPPLVRTNTMINSFRSQASRTQVKIDNTAEYFDYHQEGTGRIPARVMMKVDQARLTHITEIVEQHLRREVGI